MEQNPLLRINIPIFSAGILCPSHLMEAVFFVKSQSAVLNFCHLTSFIFCKMKKVSTNFVMGSQLNSNVQFFGQIFGRSIKFLQSSPFNKKSNLRSAI
jgi:hypothetical protein